MSTRELAYGFWGYYLGLALTLLAVSLPGCSTKAARSVWIDCPEITSREDITLTRCYAFEGQSYCAEVVSRACKGDTGEVVPEACCP